MPTSVMYAVPPGSTRASAVGTWVWVPTTAVTRAVQIPAEADLLAGRLGVHVDEDVISVSGQAVQHRVGLPERGSSDVQEQTARQRHHPQPDPVALDGADPVTGLGAQIVGRPQDALLAVEVGIDLALAVGVVAERDHVDAGVEELIGDLRRDSEAPRRVLAVDDQEVEAQPIAQHGDQPEQRAAAKASDHVSDEQDGNRLAHVRSSPILPRRCISGYADVTSTNRPTPPPGDEDVPETDGDPGGSEAEDELNLTDRAHHRGAGRGAALGTARPVADRAVRAVGPGPRGRTGVADPDRRLGDRADPRPARAAALGAAAPRTGDPVRVPGRGGDPGRDRVPAGQPDLDAGRALRAQPAEHHRLRQP